jgi:general stress protein YciG
MGRENITPKGNIMAAKRKRGFAAMDQAQQRAIASKGGRAAHERGTAHEFSPVEARRAGRRGGQKVSRDREHMAEIGRRGGEHSHGGRNGANRPSNEASGAEQ